METVSLVAAINITWTQNHSKCISFLPLITLMTAVYRHDDLGGQRNPPLCFLFPGLIWQQSLKMHFPGAEFAVNSSVLFRADGAAHRSPMIEKSSLHPLCVKQKLQSHSLATCECWLLE